MSGLCGVSILLSLFTKEKEKEEKKKKTKTLGG